MGKAVSRGSGAGWAAWLCVLRMAALCICAAASPASAQRSVEASVKAAYLYRFLAYVEWPAMSFQTLDAPLVIGVLGADDVRDELERDVAGRRAHGRVVEVRTVTPGTSLQGLHVLYVGRGAAIPATPDAVLIVTDRPTGIPRGGVLNFVTVDGRVRFEASLPAAESAGLRLSARLLAVAERVVTP